MNINISALDFVKALKDDRPISLVNINDNEEVLTYYLMKDDFHISNNHVIIKSPALFNISYEVSKCLLLPHYGYYGYYDNVISLVNIDTNDESKYLVKSTESPFIQGAHQHIMNFIESR